MQKQPNKHSMLSPPNVRRMLVLEPPTVADDKRQRCNAHGADNEEDGSSNSSKRQRLVPPPHPLAAAAAPPPDPLDQILVMCRGEIISGVPNLQLFHFILVYGHCGGIEGVCMDSTMRIACIQQRIYQNHVHHATQHFSCAAANNHQSKFVPNDWIDTFCKLMVDVNIGLPRIHALCKTIQQLPTTGDGRGGDLHLKLHNELAGVASMLQSGCARCYDRRMMDLQVLKHPNAMVAKFFPCSLGCDGMEAFVHALKKWVRHLLLWVCIMYENACFCCFHQTTASSGNLRVPSPQQMGILQEEFRDWSSIVSDMARKRTQFIREKLLPSLLLEEEEDGAASADAVERILVACWKQVAVLNMEIVNILIFYISYTVRDRGESYIRQKLSEMMVQEFSSKQWWWGNDQLLERLRFSLNGGPVVRLPSKDALTQRVARIMLYGNGSPSSQNNRQQKQQSTSPLLHGNGSPSSQNKRQQKQQSISPLVCIRLIQFAHGIFRLMADQVLYGESMDSCELLQQVLVLDAQGIFCLQKVIRWVSNGMVAIDRGCAMIRDHFASQLLLETTCRHAFTEAVLRIAHYRSFGTGRRFVMDAVHMLLRVAGFDLACRLLKLMASSEEGDVQKTKEEAVHCIVEMMTSWHCIMTMTTAASASFSAENNRSSKAFEDEISSEQWCSSHLCEEDALFSIVQCVKSYVKDVAMPARCGQVGAANTAAVQEEQHHSFERENIDSGSDSDSDDNGSDSRSSRQIISLPYMYMHSIGMVPFEVQRQAAAAAAQRMVVEDEDNSSDYDAIASMASNRRRGDYHAEAAVSLGNPTVAGKQDPNAVIIWNFCWEALRKRTYTKYVGILPMFQPILLYSATMARNMIAVNAYYQHEHIARALVLQMQAVMDEHLRKRNKQRRLQKRGRNGAEIVQLALS